MTRRLPKGTRPAGPGRGSDKELRAVDPEGWYPIAKLLDVMERMDAKVGTYAMMQMGRKLFKMSHEERVREVVHSARDVLYGFDGLYDHANRGKDIGGWKVVCTPPFPASAQWVTTNGPVGAQTNAFVRSGTRLLAGTGGGGVFVASALKIDGTNLFAATGAGMFRRPLAEMIAP